MVPESKFEIEMDAGSTVADLITLLADSLGQDFRKAFVDWEDRLRWSLLPVRGKLDVPGALSKPGNHLLRLAGAEPQAGPLTLFEDAGACRKIGFRENSPTPQLIDVYKTSFDYCSQEILHFSCNRSDLNILNFIV